MAFALMTVIPILCVGYFLLVYLIPNTVTNENIFLVISLSLFLSLLGFTFLHKTAKAISKLRKIFEGVAKGDIMQTCEMHSGTELDDIAEYVNLILQKLRQSQQDLKQFSGQLEGKVEERTAELKKIQRDLLQSEKLAALGRFSLGITHEVKNPLGIVLGGMEFLEIKLSGADQEVKTAIEKIKEAVLRADTIIGNLLKFARPSELKTEKVKLEDLINATLSLFKYRTSSSNIEIITEFAGEDICSEVDKGQMQQVFFNILANAVDAMPNGGKITIKIHKITPLKFFVDNPRGVIEITDTGEGISKDDLPKIFEPFFTTKRDKKGTGLGLSMTNMIINNHKGNLTVESELGKGTTFKIFLPITGGTDEKNLNY
jgi:two-component system NtrC family sensor kinase